MLTGWGGKKGGISAVLILLLVCLCFSRGEGIRLMPFAETPVHADAGGTKISDSIPRVTERIQAPMDRKADSNLVKNLFKIADSAGVPGVAGRTLFARHAYSPASPAVSWTGPSKFGLTSSSDRSPPSRFFV
jgi:hypothetical protein